MADKKVFTIAINGMDKSYEDVVKLQKALEGIDKTLLELTQNIQDNNTKKEESNKLSYDEDISIKEKKELLKQLKEQYDELEETRRDSSEGYSLLNEIQMLQEELSDLDKEIKNHLSTLGVFGGSLNIISEGFETATGMTKSLSEIFSSGTEVLKLFGIESESLSATVEKLTAITSTLNTLQSLHSALVAKDSIVMKGATIVKNLYTAATQGSSLALKGFKTALVSTGVGAFIVLLGYLIANFEDIKKEIGNAVGGMDKFDAIMQKIEPVIAGVGNVLLQFLLNPIKQVINVIEGLINVFTIFQEKGIDGFGDAIDEIKNTAKKGIQIQADAYNLLGNYEKAHNESLIASAEESRKKILEINANVLDNHIKNMEDQKGADWKYTEEGIKTYNAYFALRLAMYEKDSEEYIKLQREKSAYDKEVTEHKKPKASGSSRPKKDPNEYLRELKSVQAETDGILADTEQKQIEHLRKMAASIQTEDAIDYIKQVAGKEQNILNQKHARQVESLQEHQSEMQKKYKGNAAKLREINEAFEMQLYALQENQGKERLELKRRQGKNLQEIENKIKEAALNKSMEAYDKELDATEKFIGEKKEITDKLNKELLERNGLGLINIGKTKENYNKAINADKQYLDELKMNHLRRMDILGKELNAAGTNQELMKAIKNKMVAEDKNYSDEKANTNKRINNNTKESTALQQKSFEELHTKMTEVWGKINQGMGDAIKIASSIFQEQLNDIKERLEETTKQYDAVVEKRKEAQSKIQSLEEEAKNASGGRAIVLQEQIARQMEANAELAKQEQELAKKKEKLEKDAAKKDKQMKKVELGQNLITGIANTALAVTNALKVSPFPVGLILASLAGAAGAVQTGIIARQMAKLEDGGLLRGKRHMQGGMRIEGTNIEVEGDEFVVNRESTHKNLGLISYINKNRKELLPEDVNNYFTRSGQSASNNVLPTRRMYEEGGQLTNLEVMGSITAPSDNKILEAISRINFRPVVSVVEISNAQNSVTQIKDIAGV